MFLDIPFVVLKRYFDWKMWEFCTVLGWNFWALPAQGKVSVNQKIFSGYQFLLKDQNCFLNHLRTNLILGSEKFVESGKLDNMRYFYSLSLQKLAAGRWNDFPPEKFILKYFQTLNKCGFNYFRTKIYSWAKFKENWFSDPKRSGPVLGRVPHKLVVNSPTHLRK